MKKKTVFLILLIQQCFSICSCRPSQGFSIAKPDTLWKSEDGDLSFQFQGPEAVFGFSVQRTNLGKDVFLQAVIMDVPGRIVITANDPETKITAGQAIWSINKIDQTKFKVTESDNETGYVFLDAEGKTFIREDIDEANLDARYFFSIKWTSDHFAFFSSQCSLENGMIVPTGGEGKTGYDERYLGRSTIGQINRITRFTFLENDSYRVFSFDGEKDGEELFSGTYETLNDHQMQLTVDASSIGQTEGSSFILSAVMDSSSI